MHPVLEEARRLGPIVDAHFHLFRDEPQRNERFLADSVAVGTERVCAFLSGLDAEGRLAEHPNRDALAFREKHPAHVLCFARVHPDDGDKALDELTRLVGEEGFSGLKLSMNACAADKAYEPIVRRCAELRIPILFHAFMGREFHWEERQRCPNESDVTELVDLARRVPEAKIIMSHFNLGDWEFGLKAVADVPSLYPCCSGSGFDRGGLELAVQLCGADRIIYGTDSSMWTCLAEVVSAEISDDDKRLVFSGNLLRLLNMRE